MYQKELNALKKAGRFRQRRVWDKELRDFKSPPKKSPTNSILSQ